VEFIPEKLASMGWTTLAMDTSTIVMAIITKIGLEPSFKAMDITEAMSPGR